jgi:iron-regulated transporter 1
MVTALASMSLSSSIGRWIDHGPNRLKTLLTTITANRLTVIIACILWLFIVGEDSQRVHERGSVSTVSSSLSPLGSETRKFMLFSIILVLGIIEKLSGAANMMSMERDWVVTVAAADGEAYDLTRLNSVMRRIDLICKLVAPIMVSVIISATSSVKVGVFVVGGMSAASWALEWRCAKRVWDENEKLRVRKNSAPAIESENEQTSGEIPALERIRSQGQNLLGVTTTWVQRYASDFKLYFSSNVWVPSMALSLLHLSVLSYSATFITYLLSMGFSLNLITMARAAGSVVEISSTIVTPFGVEYLGKAHHHHRHRQSADEDENDETGLLGYENIPGNVETGLERLGLWGVTWQLLNLVSISAVETQILLIYVSASCLSGSLGVVSGH